MALGTIVRNIGVLFGYEVDRNSEQQAESSINELKNLASSLLSAIGITLSVSGVKSAITDCVNMASELEEMQNKFDVVFSGMTDEVEEWAQTFADSIGRNANDIKTYIADQQNLLVGFTDGSDEARRSSAELAEEMTSLALDLSSFANTDESLTVERMTKAVMGETEAARSLGAVLNETTRADAMLRMGLSGTFDSLDQYTKMTVNLNAIQYQSKDAIGDCARCTDSYESTLRQFQARLKEIKQIIGQFFLPTFQKVYSYLNKGLTAIRNWLSQLSSFADKVGGSEKIIAVFGSALAAVIALFSANTIAKFVATLGKLVTGLGLSAAAAMSLFLAFLLVALLIEDFIAFMNGEDSLLAVIFQKTGVDADAIREKVTSAWNKIKATLSNAKQFFDGLFSKISGLWDQYGPGIVQTISDAVTFLVDKFSELGDWFEEHQDIFQRFGEFIGDTIVTAINLIAAVIGDVSALLSGFFDGLSSHEDSTGVFELLSTAVSSLLELISALTTVLSDNKEIFEAVGKIVGTVVAVAFDTLTTAAGLLVDIFSALADIVSSVVDFFHENKDAADLLAVVLGTIAALLIAYNASAIESAAASGLMSAAMGVWSTISGIAATATTALGAAFQFLTSPIGLVIIAIGAIIAVVVLLINHWDEVKAAASAAWEWICGVFSGAAEWFNSNIVQPIISFFTGLKDSIIAIVGNIKDSVVNGFQAAIDFITGLPAQAVQWGADIINGIVNGIKNAIGGITDAVSGVASKIKSLLGFSEPEEGPLSDFHTYMPDMIDSMVTGIESGQPAVQAAIASLALGIEDAMSQLPEKALTWGQDIINGLVLGITDSMEQLTSAIDTTPDMINSMVTGIENGQAAVQTAMVSLALVVEEAMSQLSEKALEQGKSVVNSLSAGITSAMGQLTGAVSAIPDIIDFMAAGIESGQPTVKAAVTSLVLVVGDAMSQLSERALEQGENVANSLSTGIISSIGQLTNTASDILLNIINSVVTAIESNQSAVQTAMVSLALAIDNTMNQIPKKALMWGQDIIGNLALGITGSMERLTSAVGAVPNMIDSVVASIENSQSTVKTAVTSLALSAEEVMNQLPEKALELGQNIINSLVLGITNSIEQLINIVPSMLDMVDSMVTGIESMYPIVRATMGSIALSIEEIVSQIPAKSQALGQDIIDGLVLGITSSMGQLTNAFSVIPDMIDSMVSGISNGQSAVKTSIVSLTLGIEEIMSRLPENALIWGQDIISSLALGITGSIGQLTSAVSDAAQVIENYVGFSEPEEGPLSNFHIYMPDMIDSMVAGIAGGQPTVRAAMDSLALSIEESMNQLPEKALKWGQDIMNNLVLGITSSMGQLTSAVSTVAQTIDNYVGFSEPEEGPLSNFHTYMPDMIQLMAEGINNGRNTIQSALGTLSGDMSAIINGGAVSAGTASVLSGSSQTNNTNVTQNVNINNQFNGDIAGQQKSSVAMDKAATDSTSAMARALAFAK